MQHYLIARQLDDDAHDWAADLKRGQISYVVALLLKDAGPNQPQATFWQQTLPKICSTMQRHLRQAQTELTKCSALRPNNYLKQLLDGIAVSVQTTLMKQNQATNFLVAYRGKKTK